MTDDIKEVRNGELLRMFEREVCLRHYDPCSDGEHEPYTLNELRVEVRRRMKEPS